MKISTLELVKQMQSQGRGEKEITEALQAQGTTYKDISQALEQSKITAAVENGDPTTPQANAQNNQIQTQNETQNPGPTQTTYEQIPGMEQSVASNTRGAEEFPVQSPEQGLGEYEPQAYPTENSEYQQYDPYQGSGAVGISSDTITEISEQVVSERMMEIRKHLEKVMNFKTTTESKIEFLEDRLKRIEKILDTLQSSVLRKVGDYVTNVQDIKNELIETQQTFSKLVPELRKKISHKKSTKHAHHKKKK